jgi:hypothetical protein
MLHVIEFREFASVVRSDILLELREGLFSEVAPVD